MLTFVEFNEEQRLVFCVFSGDGVHKLRQHLANDPTAYPNDDISMYDDGPDSDDIGAGDLPTATAPQYPVSAPPYTTQAPQFPAHTQDALMMQPGQPYMAMPGQPNYTPNFGAPIGWQSTPFVQGTVQYFQQPGSMQALYSNSNLALHSGPPGQAPHGSQGQQGQHFPQLHPEAPEDYEE
jgi:hypothetical protein